MIDPGEPEASDQVFLSVEEFERYLDELGSDVPDDDDDDDITVVMVVVTPAAVDDE